MLSFFISIIPFILINDYSFISKKYKHLSFILYLLFVVFLCLFFYSGFTLKSIGLNVLGALLSYKIILDIYDGKIEKKNLYKMILVFIIYFGIELLVGMLFSIYLGYKNIDPDTISDVSKLKIEMIPQAITLIIYLFMYKDMLTKHFIDFKKNYKKYLPKAIGTFIIAYLFSIIVNLVIMKLTGVEESVNENIVQGYIKASPIVSLLSMGLFAPFVEEILFRQSIYDTFKYNKILFVIVSAVTFGLVHVLFSATSLGEYAYGLSYMILGYGIAKAYADTDNYFTGFTLHLLNNVIAVLLSII